ncbi:HtaA domain-containing protein [Aeromicrobium sp. Marseille-Q0843]|uniref:HtaA domain-containing protein n=1 Tax=Aeromicrobium phoceense TaxID=2754045 RepID=A0A838X8R9_9ACTN|nr:HtaA domain-containing protein [Aeromicrobium phoceense]MBA4606975.1 HtaA domain-containing protein [Aeromicrobium phoceense]
MSPHTLVRGRRLLAGTTVAALTAGVLALTPATAQAAESQTIEDGSISWGLKASFRNYLTSPIAHGTITPTAPATDTGTQTVFPQASGSWAAGEASVGAKGAVRFYGHDGALDLTISDPRIVVAGSGAQLVVDAVDSEDVAHEDVAFADIQLAGAVSSSPVAVTITDAPTTITAAGSGLLSNQGSAFYAPGTALDPISAQLEVASKPAVTVSKVTFAPDETATVTVNGSGFDPQDVIGTRPPFAGRSGGAYVVIGYFSETWRPSAGAPSSARKVVQQKWALPAGQFEDLSSGGAFELNADGTFETSFEISKALLDTVRQANPEMSGSFGIYTYPGSGAANPAFETYTPISFVPAVPVTKSLSTAYGRGGTVGVTAPVAGTVTVAGLGSKVVAAGGTAAFAVPRTQTAGTKSYRVTFAPTDASLTAPAATTVTVKIARTAASKGKVKVTRKPTSKKKGLAVVSVKGASGAAAPTGKVKIKLTKGKKSKYVTANLSSGKRLVKLPKLAKGKWVVRVAYYGNANYTPRGYVKAGSFKVAK